MPLADIRLDFDTSDIPADVLGFIREAERRIDAYQQESRVPGFVATNLEGAYCVLRAAAAAPLASGRLFCEWGSGFGAVASLAALVGFDAIGIEIETELVDAARRLAADFAIPVEFVRGSFLPPGCSILGKVDPEFAWLKTEAPAEMERRFEPSNFDVIFAYPWPAEEDVTVSLFERYSAPGALFVSYHGGERFQVRRKIGRKRRR